MKWPLVIILPLLWAPTTFAQEFSLKAQKIVNNHGPLGGLLGERKNNLKILKRIKYLMINGLVPEAKEELLKLPLSDSPLKLIRDRYLAIVFLLENQWEKSLKILNQSPFQTTAHYPKICLLKVLSLMALDENKHETLEGELRRCSHSHRHQKETDFTWPETIIRLRKSPTHGLPPLPHTSPNSPKELHQTVLWLKLALYLGREKSAFKELQKIPLRTLPLIPKRARELMGLLFYRAGKKKEALGLIKDINLGNAHNIRAHMALQNKNYQKAYESFQLALGKKENSLNALRGLLPLSWANGDLLGGLKAIRLAQRPGWSHLGDENFLPALLTELGENTKALPFLLSLKEQQRQTDITNKLLSFNYLMMARPKKSLLSTYELCLAFDGVNCYLLTLLTKWENLPQRLQEKKAIDDSHGIDLTQLSGQGPKASALAFALAFAKEEIFIDQKDIEELDFLERKQQTLELSKELSL